MQSGATRTVKVRARRKIATSVLAAHRPTLLGNLQCLRAVAALNVVLAHVIIYARAYGLAAPLFSGLNYWGACGVDIFFVISGFIMVYTQETSRKSAPLFLRSRLIRIVPIYWLMTLALFIPHFIVSKPINGSPPTFGFLSQSLFFVSRLIYGGSPVVFVGWTLEYEMLFYAIFALGIAIGPKRGEFLVALILASSVVLGGVAPIVLEFLAGMAIAHVYLSAPAMRGGIWLAASGAALLLLSVGGTVDPNLRTVIWGGPAILLVLGMALSKQIRGGMLVELGGASYSIYLIQVFAIPLFYKMIWRFVPGWLPRDLVAVMAVTFTALAGWLSYRLIEVPISRALRRRSERAPNALSTATPAA